MHIDTHRDTIKACRFCFMCRHLSPIGNVTYRESDSPRGRALWLDRALGNPRLLAVPDFQQTIYDADLSAACRRHCVNHYDEAGLVLAARRDVVESGHAPVAVETLRAEFAAATVTTHGDAAARVVIYENAAEAARVPEMAAALAAILAAAGVNGRVVSSADSGKALLVLGDQAGARAHATRLREMIAGAGTRQVVTSSPAAFDAFRRDYPDLGVPFGNNVEILHSSDFILRLLETERIKCGPVGKLTVVPLASDFLRNYADGHNAIARVLARIGAKVGAFGTNSEESYTAGEGAVVLERLNPRLVEKLCGYVLGRIANPAGDVLLTASPYTKAVLRAYAGCAVRLTTLEETVAGLLT